MCDYKEKYKEEKEKVDILYGTLVDFLEELSDEISEELFSKLNCVKAAILALEWIDESED